MLAAHGGTEQQFSFKPSEYIKFRIKKRKHGGRVSIQAAESDLHSRDRPRADEQSNRFCRHT
jgi:hypothetical protein